MLCEPDRRTMAAIHMLLGVEEHLIVRLDPAPKIPTSTLVKAGISNSIQNRKLGKHHHQNATEHASVTPRASLAGETSAGVPEASATTSGVNVAGRATWIVCIAIGGIAVVTVSAARLSAANPVVSTTRVEVLIRIHLLPTDPDLDQLTRSAAGLLYFPVGHGCVRRLG